MSESHELLANSSDPFARGPASARLGTGRAASRAARKGVTAGSLIFLGSALCCSSQTQGLVCFVWGGLCRSGGNIKGFHPTFVVLGENARSAGDIVGLLLSSSWELAALMWENETPCWE